MLTLTQLSLRRGPRLLFEDATLTIHHGQKAGITGANGTGKSSLFALIRNELHADSGSLEVPTSAVIAHVAQETPASERSALDYVIDGDKELREIQTKLAKAEREHNGEAQAHLHTRMDNIDGYTATSRSARLLHGLGFTSEQQRAAVSTFSGGWRMRLNLAQALMCRSDILLLDEPTNHLDLDAVLWLESWLHRYPGTLLLISHDRDFLDNVVSRIAHIEQNTITLYSGNYTEFEKQRSEALAQQQAAYKKQQREVAHMQSYVDRFRAKATKARQAQSRLKALERMTLIAPAHVDSPFHFSIHGAEKNPSPLLKLDKVSVGYNEQALIKNIKLILEPGARIGLLGPNGAGKSTLIKLLANELCALDGEVIPHQYLQTGYFAQHQLEQLRIDDSALNHLQRLDKNAAEQTLRDHLGGFGFHGDRAVEPVGPFSGGEKARLVLAMLVYQRPNLLLLDEPTNHLDLEMRLALSMALQDYEGAMVIVSHDRHMLRTVCDQFYLVHDGKAEVFDGDLDDYRNYLQQFDKENETTADTDDENAASVSKKDQRRLAAEARKRSQPLRNELKKLETTLAKLEEQKSEIESLLADASIYDDEKKDELKKLLSQQAETRKKLSETEERWMEVGEELEMLENTTAD